MSILSLMKNWRKVDRGFTLLELMVVVLVIAILLAIAIPTFLGTRTRAQDGAAQQTLMQAATAAKADFLRRGRYADDVAARADLAAEEPAIRWVDHTTNSTAPGMVSVDVPSGGPTSVYAMAARSDSGTCFYLRLDMEGSDSRSKIPNHPVACRSHDYLSGPDTGW